MLHRPLPPKGCQVCLSPGLVGMREVRKQCCCPLLALKWHGVQQQISGSPNPGWCGAHPLNGGGLGSWLLRLPLVSLQASSGAGAWETVTDTGLTSACPPGDRTLWQCSHFRQKRCQFLPRELTFSAVGNKVELGLQGSQVKQRVPSFPLLPHPAPQRQWGVSLGGQLLPARVPCPIGGKGVWDHTLRQLVCSRNPGAHNRPVFSPSSAQASPKKTGCWQRGQVQLMAPLRAAGSVHSGHPAGLCSAPSAGSTHGSASSLIGLNPLLLEAH